ncbi:MAG: hypothetical protein N2037_01530 [Acidimicrobiales bacterium]|nr:hypothetical protein [Acidimicrobiales bacterium]
MTDHGRLLSDGYLDGIESRSMAELRAMRAECVEAETGLSYLRRLVQGALDIIHNELERRAAGSHAGDLATLVAELPDALGVEQRPAVAGRLPRTLEPTEVDPELAAELGQLVSAGRTARLPEMTDEELRAFADELKAFESKVSERRRRFFKIIDALQGEIARRYQIGEASVESLLEG